MPGITEFPEQLKAIEDLLQDERKARAKLMQLEWAYYYGEHKQQLAVKEGQPDDNVIMNVSGRLVDQGVDMLFGQGVEFELDETDRTPVEDRLDEIWGANRKDILLTDIALNGFISGHPAVKLVKGDGGPRIINLNPAIVSVFWAMDDIDNVLAYVLSWDNNHRQEIRKVKEQWHIRDVEKNRSGQWTVVAGSESVWTWPWPPVLDWKNRPTPNRYYGRSDLSHSDLNDRINFVASNTNRIIKFHAHPRTIGLGMKATDVVESEVNSFYTVEAGPNDAEIFNLEMMGDLGSSMKFLDTLRGEFYAEGGGVDLSSMKDKIGQLTNFGLRVLFKGALDRLELKRLLYGEALAELSRRMLDMDGKGEDNLPLVKWPEPLPENQLENVQSLGLEDAMGVVSKQTIAGDLGRDWEVEQERMAQETEANGDLGTTLLRAFEQGRG